MCVNFIMPGRCVRPLRVQGILSQSFIPRPGSPLTHPPLILTLRITVFYPPRIVTVILITFVASSFSRSGRFMIFAWTDSLSATHIYVRCHDAQHGPSLAVDFPRLSPIYISFLHSKRSPNRSAEPLPPVKSPHNCASSIVLPLMSHYVLSPTVIPRVIYLFCRHFDHVIFLSFVIQTGCSTSRVRRAYAVV